MGILFLTDALCFAPSLSNLATDDLAALLNFVNFLVESPQGANRPLGIQQYTEKLKLNLKLQNLYLSYFPIALDPIAYPITVQVRTANALNMYSRGIPVQPWIDVAPDKFILDIDGQLHLAFGQEYPYNFPNFNAFIRPVANEMQVSYWAGLDFQPYTPQSTISHEVKNLKIAAGEICKYLNTKMYQGVSSIQVPFDEFSVQFSQGNKAFQIPDILLYPFRNYKPRMRF
jgi:hypothetical protein